MNKPDINRTTAFAYNADGKLLTLTSQNDVTGDQVTRFVYGTTLAESGVASNELLQAKIYPDSDDGDDLTDGNDGVYDRVEYSYNRLGQRTQATDQAGTIHAYDYDLLGRLVHDRVTLPTGSTVDSAVLRISREYEVRGMLSKITSYDNATVSQGNVVNQVELAYNDFAQLATDYQSHSGAVNQQNTPVVSYQYADGSANTIRPAWIKYPNGRQLDYNYGTAEEMDDMLSRISRIKEHTGSATLAAYTRLGVNQVVDLSYPEPAMDMTYITQTDEPVGDAGDQYTGLDRFGRVEDIRWIKDVTELERVQHGYDRVGSKRWRQNLVATSGQDEFYNYDGLYQLTELQRGSLNNNQTAIAGIPAKQEDFGYDPTGNWRNYLVNVAGTATLNQNRTHNQANETWQVDGSNATVACDPAGNMVKMPKVGDWSTAQQLTWDAWNRLVEITEGETTMGQYQYDGLFRRTKKTVNGQTQHFYYSSLWQVLEVRASESGSAQQQFVWGMLAIDDLIFRDRFTSGSERLYAIHDTMHVTAIVNASGVVQERYAYDAFGDSRVMNASFNVIPVSAYGWETRFCGYQWDGETGLYQVRYRYLHSGLGRWLSRDPILEAGGLNLYRYVDNTPVNLYDDHGNRISHEACEWNISLAMSSDNTVQELKTKMTTLGCQIPPANCYCCSEGGSGYYDGSRIKVCENNVDAIQVASVIQHELVHAYDRCTLGPITDCNDRACREIRAAMFSCAGLLRGTREGYVECVKRSATWSVDNTRGCEGQGAAVVEQEFELCFSYMRPPVPAPPHA